MKRFIFVFVIFLNIKVSFADDAMKQLISINKSEALETNIFSSKDYYFSQVTYKIGKKFNRRKTSRKAVLEAITNFKKFILNTNFKDKKDILNEWGGNTYSQNIIKIKKSRKLKDLRKNDNYIVVFSFPKDAIILNRNKLELKNIINFNVKNHFQLPERERDNFLSKINFKDIKLLWKINEAKKHVNLNNVVSHINPIEYQKKFEKVYNFNKIKINHLDILPSTKFIVTNYVKNNNLSELKQIIYMSSVCSHDNDFLNKIREQGFIIVNKNILNYESPLGVYVKLCNGFLSFDKKLLKKNIDDFAIIEEKFNSGNTKIINEVHNLLEQYLDKNPLYFKAWNYLSGVLRYKKKFDLALIVSRVEISIALSNNNLKQYNEALKSYSKARLNFDKNITDGQRYFLKSL